MTKEEILAAAGYPNTPEGIAAFYEEYDSPDAFFAKHGGSLSGAPHNGQPTADQFFKFGEPTAGNMNIPMGNPRFLADGGVYYGGPTYPMAYGGGVDEYCWGGGLPGGPNEMPEMLKGGFNSPMNYGSFPAIEEGGAFDASNADDYPMLEEGGLKKILRAAANNMKKQYAKGGKTSLEGGAQNNIPQQRSQNFKDFIKSNVYNNMVDEEMGTLQQATDEAMTMQYGGMNPGMYANMFTVANMYQGAGSYPGMINYRQPTAIDPKTKMFQTALQDKMSSFEQQKQQDNMNMFNAANKFVMQSPKWFGQDGVAIQPWFKKLAEVYGQKAAPGKAGSLISQMFPNPRRYDFSNKDYSRLQELNPNFQLENLKITPEYGAVARSLGKFGRRAFGPKSVTYEISGTSTGKGTPMTDPKFVIDKYAFKPHDLRTKKQGLLGEDSWIKKGSPYHPMLKPFGVDKGAWSIWNPNVKREDGGESLRKFQDTGAFTSFGTPISNNFDITPGGFDPQTPAPNWKSEIQVPDPAEALRKQAMQTYGMSEPIKMEPYKYKENATVKLDRNYKGLGKALGQAATPTFNWLASKGEEKQYGKFQQDLENSQVADRTFIANRGNRGNYDPNTGMFRPDQMVPVQFPGGIYNQVGMGIGMYGEYGGSFANGGMPMALSGLEVKMRPGLYGTNGNRQFSLPTQVDSQKFAQQPIDVRDTLRPVPREEANLEAEKNETVLMNVGGIPAHFKIGGKRHFEGGTPLNLPENSFIYSDTSKMKIKDPTILAQFGMAPKKGGYTPAEIAKKYDINSYRKILSDPTSDDLQRKTAERMIANNNLMLSKLSLIQESKKGFPQGIPVVGMPYIMSQGIEADELLPEVDNAEAQPDADMGVARYGGNIIHQFLTKRYGGDLPTAQDGRMTGSIFEDEEETATQPVEQVPTASRSDLLAQEIQRRKQIKAAEEAAKIAEEEANVSKYKLDYLRSDVSGIKQNLLEQINQLQESILPSTFENITGLDPRSNDYYISQLETIEPLYKKLQDIEELERNLYTPGYKYTPTEHLKYFGEDVPAIWDRPAASGSEKSVTVPAGRKFNLGRLAKFTGQDVPKEYKNIFQTGKGEGVYPTGSIAENVYSMKDFEDLYTLPTVTIQPEDTLEERAKRFVKGLGRSIRSKYDKEAAIKKAAEAKLAETEKPKETQEVKDVEVKKKSTSSKPKQAKVSDKWLKYKK